MTLEAKRWASLISQIALSALIYSGCGDDDDGPDSGATDSDSGDDNGGEVRDGGSDAESNSGTSGTGGGGGGGGASGQGGGSARDPGTYGVLYGTGGKSTDPWTITNAFDVGGKLIFNSGTEIWTTDGTPSGTRFGTTDQSMSLSIALAAKQKVLFVGKKETPWVTDGTAAGTMPLAPEISGNNSAPTKFWGSTGSIAYFEAFANDVRAQLWITDGTPSGTRKVKNLPLEGKRGWIGRSVMWNEKLVFVLLEDAPTGLTRFWISDGTEANTFPLADHDLPNNIQVSMAIYKDRLYFSQQDAQGINELWVSDGTRSGTHLFKDFTPGESSSTWPSDLIVLGDRLLFKGYAPGTSGVEGAVFATDGTPDNSVQLTPLLVLDKSEGRWIRANGKLLFNAAPRDGKSSLWSTDGTSAGTIQIRSNFNVHCPLHQMAVGSGATLLFGTDLDSAPEDRTAWISDGTSAGTRPLVEDWIGTYGGNDGNCTDQNYSMMSHGNRAFFMIGNRLLETDGTPSGTHVVKPPGFENPPPYIRMPVSFKQWVFFSASDGTTEHVYRYEPK